MSKENNGGPAFPSHGTMGEVCHEGMTLRTYIATKTMQALIIAGLNSDAWEDYDDLAKSACAAADALIAELEK